MSWDWLGHSVDRMLLNFCVWIRSETVNVEALEIERQNCETETGEVYLMFRGLFKLPSVRFVVNPNVKIDLPTVLM